MTKEWRMFLKVTAWLIILGILLWIAAGCTIHKKIIVNVKQVDVDIRLELKGD